MIYSMRTFVLSCLAFCILTPVACAQAASSTGSVATGSGGIVDVWALRRERVGSFGSQWATFAIVRKGWVTKWQKAHDKLMTHVDRCHSDVRSANRDTLLPVTLQCERGQLMMEKDSLNNERGVIAQWPGIPETSKTALLDAIDALQDAIQPVIDGIDAKVFTTVDAFMNVRANLLTQYRQPYWIAAERFRADAALMWLDSLLLTLKSVSEEELLIPATQEKILSALVCYEAAEPLLVAAQDTETPEASLKNFSQAFLAIVPCPSLLDEAQSLQMQSASSSSARP
ncbi:MAG: hypothetical protein PHX87_02780 [Candidatus Peribacteraceae bacterium]|nr:hypothetical protein [Candidatus Peribacteraceae bacterium]MDD5742333.1 hypothetical protein [Candidatus Peribacteraceae bacterium]